jgi:hypothetical protein
MNEFSGSEWRISSAAADGIDTSAEQSGGPFAASLVQPFVAERSDAVARSRSTGGRWISSDSGAQQSLLEQV